MDTRTITQTITFKATPHEVYQALMNSKEHAAFTDAHAAISPSVGGSISAYDGYISGKNLVLKEDKKIVQEWRADEDGWPKNHASKLTLELKATKTGTELHMTHAGVPEALVNEISDGWHEHYWFPLKRMLER